MALGLMVLLLSLLSNMPNNNKSDAPDVTSPPVSIDLPISSPHWPTKAGAIEYRPDFHKEMSDAYGGAWANGGATEAFFYVKNDGSLSPVTLARNAGKVDTHIPADARMVVHTHPYPQYSGDKPSDADIQQAKTSHIPIVTLSTGGMYETGPDGNTITVAPGTNWMDVKHYIKTAQEQETKSSPAIPWEHKK